MVFDDVYSEEHRDAEREGLNEAKRELSRCLKVLRVTQEQVGTTDTPEQRAERDLMLERHKEQVVAALMQIEQLRDIIHGVPHQPI